MAAAQVEPSSTSCRTCSRICWKYLLSCCCARISRHWTSGRPASIITENWRVNTDKSFDFTFLRPPIFGMPISRPFSFTDVSVTCSRRRIWRNASRLSATRSPTTISFKRLRPLKTYVGITVSSGSCDYRLSGYGWPRTNRSRLRVRARVRFGARVDAGTTIDQLAQLIDIRRTLQRRLHIDLALVIQRGQRLIESLHAVLVLARLHHRVDLVHLV